MAHPRCALTGDGAALAAEEAAPARLPQSARAGPERDERDPVRASHGLSVELARPDGHLLALVGVPAFPRVDGRADALVAQPLPVDTCEVGEAGRHLHRHAAPGAADHHLAGDGPME